jgi:hypothetical protein
MTGPEYQAGAGCAVLTIVVELVGSVVVRLLLWRHVGGWPSTGKAGHIGSGQVLIATNQSEA